MSSTATYLFSFSAIFNVCKMYKNQIISLKVKTEKVLILYFNGQYSFSIPGTQVFEKSTYCVEKFGELGEVIPPGSTSHL